MKRLILIACAAALVFGTALGQTLTVGTPAEPISLDPHGTNDQPSARVRVQIYDQLVTQTNDLELVPGLAESWTQVDELTWDFFIREGVTFHNGDPLTAHEVKFTFDRLRDPEVAAAGAFLVGAIDTVEVIDDMTIRITTQEPFAPLLAHLSHSVTSILNERSVTEAGEDYGTAVAVGTGAFEFVSWQTGSQLVLDRNDDWWGGQAGVERIVFRPITEGTVRSIELETAGVDIAYNLEPRDVSRLDGQQGIVLHSFEELGTTYVGFNTQSTPFDDVRVRQAINYAVDMETIVDVIWEGQAAPASGPLSPGVFASHQDLEPYGYDPERARELLEEAGVGDGFSTTLWTNDNPLRIQIAEIAQAQLGEIGIDVDVQVLEWSTYLAETAAGNHDMFILAWGTVTADADYGLYALFHSSQFGSAGNRTFWSHDRVDELLDAGRRTADADERLAIYREAQEIIAEEAPWIFSAFLVQTTGVRERVEGYENHPNGSHRLYTVTLN
jgi:peptide/nickel transport system substrate-binding protein